MEDAKMALYYWISNSYPSGEIGKFKSQSSFMPILPYDAVIYCMSFTQICSRSLGGFVARTLKQSYCSCAESTQVTTMLFRIRRDVAQGNPLRCFFKSNEKCAGSI